MAKERILWVDFVKIFAMIYIVSMHFFQSMMKAGYLQDSTAWQWAMTVCEWMMVQLFFFCSGYLYQKLTKIQNFADWKNGIINKFIHLMIPYFLFCGATILIKMIAVDLVNTPIEGNPLVLLFVEPLPPYWFLYILFIYFVIILPIKSQKSEVFWLLLSAVLFLIFVFVPLPGVFSSTCRYAMWFVLGMSVAYKDWLKVFPRWVKYPLLLFIPVSVILYINGIGNGYKWIDVAMCAWASLMAVLWARYFDEKVRGNQKVQSTVKFLMKYSMPVFLMQTIFAAGCRIVLNLCGVRIAFIQVVVGYIVTFVGPSVLAMLFWSVKNNIIKTKKGKQTI